MINTARLTLSECTTESEPIDYQKGERARATGNLQRQLSIEAGSRSKDCSTIIRRNQGV